MSRYRKAPLLLCLLLISFWMGAGGTLNAQESGVLVLNDCYRLAELNYPLSKQRDLFEKARLYSIDNASKGNLPQVHFSGQATYQSDVTQVPLSLPNIDIPVMSRDQYKIYGEVSQPITDLFTVSRQKALINASSAVDEQEMKVELYKLRDRINQLYFGILLINEQISQANIQIKDIQSAINKNRAAIVNGLALKSSADVLAAEQLRADQRIIELNTTLSGYRSMLSLFLNQNIDEQTKFEIPLPVKLEPEIKRPELQLFGYREAAIDVQRRLINNRSLPKVNLFLQGGYGKPALDMLKTNFDFYYIGGIRVLWSVSAFYTKKNERQLLAVSQSTLDLQKETFLFNTRLTLSRNDAEISGLQSLMASDTAIIRLRENVRKSAQNQLEFGTATVNDYLAYVHAEELAKQSLILHRIQLLLARYQYNATSGNL